MTTKMQNKGEDFFYLKYAYQFESFQSLANGLLQANPCLLRSKQTRNQYYNTEPNFRIWTDCSIWLVEIFQSDKSWKPLWRRTSDYALFTETLESNFSAVY